MIPQLNAAGELPPGIHATTLDEIEAVFANTPKRQTLFEGLKLALASLKEANVYRVFIDGSFVSETGDEGKIRSGFIHCPLGRS